MSRVDELFKKKGYEIVTGDKTPANAASKQALEELRTTGKTEYAGKTYTAPVDLPTFGERVGGTVKGGLLGSGAGFTNVFGSLLEGLGNIGDRLQDKKDARLLAQDKEYLARHEKELVDALAAGDEEAAKWARIKINQAKHRIETSGQMGDYYSEVNQDAVDDVYKKADELAAESQRQIDEAKVGASKAGQFLVDVGAAGTQLAGDIALGAVTGAGAVAPIFIRGFGSGAQQARQKGATYEQQLGYGLASATIEALTEKIASVGKISTKAFGTGAIDDIMAGLVKAVEDHGKTAAGKAALNRLASIGTGAVGEGFEELVSGLLDPLAQKIYSDEAIDWKQAAYDAGYQFLVGAALGGAMGGIGGTDTSKVDEKTGTSYNEPKVTSPAATPEVQQLNTQAQATQAQNPGVDVLDAATSLFMSEQGCNLKTAQKRAEIVQRLIAGEEVSDKDLKRLEPTSKVTKSIFSQLTGVQFPDTPMNLEQVLPLYRTAHDVAVQAQTAVVAQVAEATVAPVQTAAPEVADEAFDQFSGLYREKHQDAADPDVRKLYDAFQSGEQTVTFGGQQLTRDQFVELLRSTGTELSDADLNALFNEVAVNTLSGIDSFDHSNDTLPLSNGGVITRKQFVELVRGEVRPDATPEELDTLFDRGKDHADKGNPMPYNEAMDKYMKEETSDAEREGTQTAQRGLSERLGVAPQSNQSRDPGRRGDGGDSASDSGGVREGVSGPVSSISESAEAEVTPQRKVAESWRAKRVATKERVFHGLKSVQVVPRRYYTKELKRMEARVKAAGGTLYAVLGPVETTAGVRATGMFVSAGRNVLVRVDHNARTLEQTFDHEFLHLCSNQDPDLMSDAVQAIVQTWGLEDMDTFYAFVKDRYKTYEKGYGEFSDSNKDLFCEELVADINAGLNHLAKMPDGLFQALHEAVRAQVVASEARLAGTQTTPQTELAEQQDTVDKENSEAIDDSNRVFPLITDTLWGDQIDTLDEIGDDTTLYFEETPNLLAEVGLGDLPMCMTKGHAKDAMHKKDPSDIHWHGVPQGIMQQLPHLLSRPAMILNSHSRPGDILVVTTAVDGDKLPIVVAIHPNGSALVDGVKGPANFITSVYGRSNFAARPGEKSENNLLYLALRDRGILYWNKERTEALAQTTGLQLPRTLEKVPSDTILKQYKGYVKGRTPERMFSMDEDDDSQSANFAELAQIIEEKFPAPKKIPDFASWGQAYMHLDEMHTLGESGLSFDVPPFMPGDTMELLYKEADGTWTILATYEKDAAGLLAFKNDYKDFLAWEKEIASVPPEFEENLDYLDIYDDSTSFAGEEDEIEFYRNRQAQELQTEREGFTDTDSENFREWFNDDSGKLTTPTGKPKVFVRGTPFAGSTKLREATEALSNGLFFSDRVDIAKRYADGATHTGVTAMDRLSGNDNETKEWRPHKLKTWNNARLYIRDTYTDKRHENGLELQGWDPETGEILPTTKAKEFLLLTNLTTRDYRESTPGLPLFSENGWRTLKTYPATKQGLDELNHDLGDFVRELGIGTRGYSRVYLSAENTLVVDAERVSYQSIPDDILPGKVQSGHESGTQSINGLVRRAFEAGYDCVIVENVSDAGGVQTQYVVKSPNQVKSVYNRGTWDKADPDMMYSLDPDSDLGLYLQQLEQNYGPDTTQRLTEYVNTRLESLRAAKRMTEAQPSVGAADAGFDPYTHMQGEYGNLEPGENPARVVDVPAQTKPNNKVSLTARTVMEAAATPESRISTIEDAVVDHKFSYTEGHNRIQINRAVAKLKKDGWEDALSSWTRDVRDGKVDADLVALGAVMLNNAGNSDMSGARYTQLLVDYTNLLRSAGQATQAARVLKNLSPEARLYGLHGYANRMNDRIRQDDPAHNIPVEKWMEVTGNLLANRLKQAVGGTRKQARTTAQTILNDLNTFAREAFPEKEKTPGRTEMERLQDLFDNYENYREAWEATKDTIRTEYADKPEALAVFEKFLQTDLAEAFLGRYFNHPEVRISGDLTHEFLNAKTDEERDAVIDRIIEDIAHQIPATKMEKFTALRYLNMLGNFKTQGRNLLGNSFNLALTKAKNQVATVLELAVNARGEKVERTKSFTKDKATYQEALKDFEKMKEIVLSGGKYQDGRRFDERIEDKRTVFKNKTLEGYRKATNWAMTKGDLVFSRIAYADALAGYLAAHGKTFETAGTALLEQARNYAVQQAAEATFRDSNMFSDAIAGMRFRNPDTMAKRVINTVSEGILPFRKTPTNILVRAVEYSPVGVLTTAAEAMYGKRTTGSVDGSKVIDSLAKNVTGTTIMALGFFLANAGLLKGSASDDEKEKAFEELTGHQAYSIELPNGMSLTLDWLAPSSIPLFLGVQVAETAAEEGLSVRTALEALGSISDPMLQMSMLQGLDDALSNASTYGDDSALVRFTGNALWSFATQGLTNTLLGQLERSLKNERSTTYRDKNKDLPDGIQYLLGKAMEKTPFVDYGQIPYIDAWGRVEQNAKTDWGNAFAQFFSPSYVSWVEESDMEEELHRLYESTGNNSVLISRPKSYFTVDQERRDLTGEEYVEYATTRGRTAYNVATDLTESVIYESLTDKQRAVAVEKAYDFANQLAKATVTGYDASQWGGDAPEGAAVPDKWVMNAAQDASEYGIPVGDFVALYAATSEVESYKDKRGETVDNSKALQIAVAIYDLGLPDAQTVKLMEDFGVNKTVRGYSEKMTRRKLESMKKKYE